VLITPYVVANDEDAQGVTSAFRERLGAWAHGNAGDVKTPPRAEPQARMPVVQEARP